MKRTVVVDTNVPKVANAVKGQTSQACVLACQKAVLDVVRDKARLRLDDGWRIIREYQQNLVQSGEPGLGAEFLAWVLTNRTNPNRCAMVSLTPRSQDPNDFEEFPRTASLNGFDPSDKKFVAVANARKPRPRIQQGLDSKWWGYRDALASVGILVEFLCSDEVQRTYERKFGRARSAKRTGRG